MLKMKGDNTYAIVRKGDCGEWLRTIKALLTAISVQDPEIQMNTVEVYYICNLIDDMLPDEEMVAKIDKMMKCEKC